MRRVSPSGLDLIGSPWRAVLFAVVFAFGLHCSEPAACKQSPADLYEERIEPLLTEDQPKSCNQCHLSGIDLALFAKSTPCETMACLVQDRLVDLDSPPDSKLLTWIERAEPDSSLITDEVIQAEYDAFLQWIEHESQCGDCSSTPCQPTTEEPFCPYEDEVSDAFPAEEDPGGCDDLVLEELFTRTIYASRGRCYPCHFSQNTTAEPTAPRWLIQEGSCEASALATMRNIIRSGYINTSDPSQSLLLLKPLAEADGGIEHGGHDKFLLNDDPGYANFLYWVTRYSECQNNLQ